MSGRTPKKFGYDGHRVLTLRDRKGHARQLERVGCATARGLHNLSVGHRH